MNIHSVRESLNHPLTAGFDLYERRPGNHQLILPIHHEDGDMVEIYLADSPKGEEYVRICDYGLTLMRLSYTYEISTPTRQQIFDSILINNGISNEEGKPLSRRAYGQALRRHPPIRRLCAKGVQHALLG